jgi:hypothetical protein
MKDDWIHTKNNYHLVIMQKISKMTRYISKMLIVLTQVMLCMFLSMNIFLNATGIFRTRQLFYRSYYFYNALKTPIYEITCFCQYCGGIIAAIAYSGTDSFIGILVLHVCGQLSILRYELKHLTDPIINRDNDALHLINKKLKFIVTRHEHLNRWDNILFSILSNL